MTIRQMIGIPLSICMLVSLGWKLMDSLSGVEDQLAFGALILIIICFILLVVRRVLTY